MAPNPLVFRDRTREDRQMVDQPAVRVAGDPSPAAASARPSPPWWQKVLRVFAFAFIGTFLTTLLPIADKIAKGHHVDYGVVKALLVSAIAAGIAAGVRAIVPSYRCSQMTTTPDSKNPRERHSRLTALLARGASCCFVS
jgi:hypothetical protein